MVASSSPVRISTLVIIYGKSSLGHEGVLTAKVQRPSPDCRLAEAKETERARWETSCQENSGATVSNKNAGQSI